MSRHEQATTARFTRRTALKAGAGLATGAALARHGVARAQDAPPIVFPETGAALPTDEVNLRWINSGPGPKGVFLGRMFEAYQAAHPNISVTFDQLPWEEIQQVVPLGARNGNAHDVFQLPLNIPSAQAVREGWVAPLDEIVPNFEAWKALFPEGSFLPGITDFDGRTYTIPMGSNRRYATLTLYNVEYMERAGYDPVAEPFTWDTYREAARTITEQGAGEYYGILLWGQSVGRFEAFVRNLGRMAGASASEDDIDWRTGEYVYTSDAYLGAIELLLALRDDGSVFPGSLNLVEAEARAQFTTGIAGFIPEGPWNIPQWPVNAPDFNFGVASTPLPNTGEPLPLTVGPGAGNLFWVYAESELKSIAGDIFHYLATPEGQTAWASVVGIADPPNRLETLQAVDLDERSQRAADLFQEQMRRGPSPLVRNPDAAQVYLERQPLSPTFGETVQGIFAGQLDDPRQAMRDLQDRAGAELDRAIEAARANGAEVTREDFVFANWDPTRDYTLDDYAAL